MISSIDEAGEARAARTSGAEGAAASRVAVRLPLFEGPLDLLLHLIRANELEITDVPIALVCDQYLEYLELMREVNLDVAGDYLLMAATLAWIKSRMLLPPEPGEEAEEGPDPRAELVARLLEYQRFKEVAQELGARPLLGREVFQARGPEPERPPEAEREIEVGLFELVDALRRVLAEKPHTGAAHEVEVERITVRERMIAVMHALEDHESLLFEETLRDSGDSPSRAVVVTTFLAILELTRLAALRVYQGEAASGAPAGPIRLLRLGDSRAWVARISEIM